MATDKQTYYVSGMHCKSCEMLIERKIKELGQVQEIKASTSSGKIEVSKKGESLSIDNLNNLFKENGYTFSHKRVGKVSSLINALLIVLVIYICSYAFGLNKIFTDIHVGIGTGVSSMFILGLAAGASSCAALSGALLLSLVKKWKSKGAVGSLLFVTGRLVSYTATGAILGYAGKLVSISPDIMTIFTILISLFMIVLALQMLSYDIFSVFQPNAPRFLTDRVTQKEENASERSLLGGFFLGMSTVFLPCGFTLTAAGASASMASPLQSSLNMLIFALGSSIVLLLIGVSGHKLTSNVKIGNIASRVIGVIILFYAINTISGQIQVQNISIFKNNAEQNTQVNLTTTQATQVIKMDASSQGYTPDSFKIKVNQPVRWEITDTGTSGCTNSIISPGLFDGQVRLTRGQTTVKEFTPTRTGTFKFSCWMGMINGSFEVVQ